MKTLHTLAIGLSMLGMGLSSSIWAADSPAAAHGPMPFSAIDTDKNGSISEVEFNAMKQQHHPNNRKSAMKMKAPAFAEFDSNHDGQLSPEELNAGREAHHQAMQAKPHCKCDEKKHHGPRFEHFDLNKDGAISEAEFTEARNQHRAEREKMGKKVPDIAKLPTFADLDTDHNGSLSKEELAAQHEKHHAH